MKQTFKFRDGFRSNGTDVERITYEIKAVSEKENGVLTAPALVEYGKNPETELHKYFEWDDKVCGDKWRNQQASQIIRAVIIVTEKEEEIQNWHLTYEEVGEEKVKFYVSSDKLALNEKLIENARKMALKYLNGLERELNELDRLSGNTNKQAALALNSLKSAVNF